MRAVWLGCVLGLGMSASAPANEIMSASTLHAICRSDQGEFLRVNCLGLIAGMTQGAMIMNPPACPPRSATPMDIRNAFMAYYASDSRIANYFAAVAVHNAISRMYPCR